MPHLISIKEQTCKCSILQASGTIWQHPNQTQCTHNGGCFDEQTACIMEQPLSRDWRYCFAFLYEQLKQTAECLRTSSQLCGFLPAPHHVCVGGGFDRLGHSAHARWPRPQHLLPERWSRGVWLEMSGRTVFCCGSFACFRWGREPG